MLSNEAMDLAAASTACLGLPRLTRSLARATAPMDYDAIPTIRRARHEAADGPGDRAITRARAARQTSGAVPG